MKDDTTYRRNISILMIFLMIMMNVMSTIAYAETDPSAQPESGDDSEGPLSEASDFVQSSTLSFLPGDGLWVSTFPDTTSFLNQTFPIDERGYVTFPLVGKIQVSQMTESQVVAFIKKNFEVYNRSPNVEVKPMLRVTMIGGFIRPGLYYVDYDMSFWNTLKLSGGPLLEDGIKELQWERNGESMIDDLMPFVEGGVSLKKMGFKSGDVVWTPSPLALTAWDTVVRDVLPILAFTATIFMVWITYQQTIIYTQTR